MNNKELTQSVNELTQILMGTVTELRDAKLEIARLQSIVSTPLPVSYGSKAIDKVESFKTVNSSLIAPAPAPAPASVPDKKSKKPEFGKGQIVPVISHDRDWTWIKTGGLKPIESIRQDLKSLGFQFSGKRNAWYAQMIIDETKIKSIF